MPTGPDRHGASSLGEYLRARRGRVSPSAVGLPQDQRRRVAGLRREEVAMLAGISSDYYLRLEQGRNRNPSGQVLRALARVLQLDESAAEHLLELGAAQPRSPRPPREPGNGETVSTRIEELVGSLGLPAFVTGRYLDVLAGNPLAAALSPVLRPGVNLLRTIFLDADARIEIDRRDLVAMFRKRVGSHLEAPRVVGLVDELSAASPEFGRAWADHDVGPATGGTVRVDHPRVGPLELNLSKLAVDGAPDQLLVVYHPTAAHPESAGRLSLLASLVAPSRPGAQEGAHAIGD